MSTAEERASEYYWNDLPHGEAFLPAIVERARGVEAIVELVIQEARRLRNTLNARGHDSPVMEATLAHLSLDLEFVRAQVIRVLEAR